MLFLTRREIQWGLIIFPPTCSGGWKCDLCLWRHFSVSLLYSSRFYWAVNSAPWAITVLRKWQQIPLILLFWSFLHWNAYVWSMSSPVHPFGNKWMQFSWTQIFILNIMWIWDCWSYKGLWKLIVNKILLGSSGNSWRILIQPKFQHHHV